MLIAVPLLAWGCSDTLSGGATEPVGSTEESSSTGPARTDEPGSLEGTLKPRSGKPDVTLRVEGGRGIRFSGLCTVSQKDTAFTGEVPRQFTYHLEGQKLSCRIQKQDSGDGSLRVILLAGDTTRSVQQTSSRNGTIDISYSGG